MDNTDRCEPRYLTDDEIEEIVSVVDRYDVIGCFPDTRPNLHAHVKERLALLLSRVRLAPAALGAMRDEIHRSFVEAQVAPFEPLGIRCAHAFMVNVMQATLDTSHASGSLKNMASVLREMSQLLNAQEPKTSSMTIVLQDPRASFDDVFDARWRFAETRLTDLLVRLPEVHALKDLVPLADDTAIDDRSAAFLAALPWWLGLHFRVMGDSVHLDELTSSKCTDCLVLELSPTAMYCRGITIADVTEVLTSRSQTLCCFSSPLLVYEGDESDPPDCYYCVWIVPRYEAAANAVLKWQRTARQTCIPDSSKEREIDAHGHIKARPMIKYEACPIPIGRIGITYLTSIVVPLLSDVLVSGVPGITGAEPASVATWSVVETMRLVDIPVGSVGRSDIGGEAWLLSFNETVMRSTGLSHVHLDRLLIECGIENITALTDLDRALYCLVRLPSARDAASVLPPTALGSGESMKTGSSSLIDGMVESLQYEIAHKVVDSQGRVVFGVPLIERILKANDAAWQQMSYIGGGYDDDTYVLVLDRGRLNDLGLKAACVTEMLSSRDLGLRVIEWSLEDVVRRLDASSSIALSRDDRLLRHYDMLVSTCVMVVSTAKPRDRGNKTCTSTRPSMTTPQSYIAALLKTDADEDATYRDSIAVPLRNRLLSEGRHSEARLVPLVRPISSIRAASQRNHIVTSGSNLSHLLTRDDIDPIHTTSNNVFEILHELGIRAATNFLVLAFMNTIKRDGGSIDPRHPLTLSNLMTCTGVTIGGSTWKNAKVSDGSTLEKACFERASTVLNTAAAHGCIDQVDGALDSYILGRPVNVGTGHVVLAPDVSPSDRTMRDASSRGQNMETDDDDVFSGMSSDVPDLLSLL